jgi:UDP-N-acetylglucosamine--dolichyl-phosphate N-acetylglucosaminephosphotransferase
MAESLIIPWVISFLVAFIFTPIWIRRAKKARLVGKDVHKPDHPEKAEMGGIVVVMGFGAGILAYIAIQTFWFRSYIASLEIMTILTSILIITIIGLMDDILGWKIGIRQRHKPILTLAAVIPMVVLNVGHHTMNFPFIGSVNLGLLYPLLVIPIAIVGASNAFNMIGGYNGIEAGMGIIILSTMGIVAWRLGDVYSTAIIFCMVFALIAFYFFNMYPAKVFPGDTMTYSVGALIAIMAIMGNMERTAVILFTPYFIELILKLRGKMQKESFAEVNKDGSLRLKYKRVYGLEHVAIKILSKIKKKVYERDVVYSLFGVELIIVGIVFVFFV